MRGMESLQPEDKSVEEEFTKEENLSNISDGLEYAKSKIDIAQLEWNNPSDKWKTPEHIEEAIRTMEILLDQAKKLNVDIKKEAPKRPELGSTKPKYVFEVVSEAEGRAAQKKTRKK